MLFLISSYHILMRWYLVIFLYAKNVDVFEEKYTFSNFCLPPFLFESDFYLFKILFYLLQFSHSVRSYSLQPHESQHARPPCLSPTPRVHSNSRPSSRWCHPVTSSSVVPFSSCPQSLPASVFSNESTLLMRWPKYWNFRLSLDLIYSSVLDNRLPS